MLAANDERDSDADVAKLWTALAGFVGAETEKELRVMLDTMPLMPIPADDKAACINAIQVLLETMPSPEPLVI